MYQKEVSSINCPVNSSIASRAQPRQRFGRRKYPKSDFFFPFFELREKFKCIEHIGKSKIKSKTSPRMPLSEKSRLNPGILKSLYTYINGAASPENLSSGFSFLTR